MCVCAIVCCCERKKYDENRCLPLFSSEILNKVVAFIRKLIEFHFHRAQMLMKSRLAGAQKGHGLLKKKADALQMRFRQILGKIIEVSLTIEAKRK